MKKINKTRGDNVFDTINYTIMILLALIFIYPFWDTLILSFSDAKVANSLGLHLVPTWPPTLGSYKEIFSQGLLFTAFRNSIFRTAVGTSLTLIVTFSGAYVLSKRDMPFIRIITVVILFTMFFSGGMIPSYILIKNLNLYNTIWALIFPMTTSAWFLLITRNFIAQLPSSMEEAAVMDGAGILTVVFRVLLPLSKPIIAVIGLWSSISHWNAWFDAYIYTPNKDLIVLQLLLRRILIDNSRDMMDVLLQSAKQTTADTIKAATIVVSVIPIACVYPSFQKYFVKGIHIGAVKG